MKNYKSCYPTNGIFFEQILFFMLSLNFSPHLDKFHRNDVSATLATTQGEHLTIFIHEIPDLDFKTKEKMKEKMLKMSIQIIINDSYEKLKRLNLLDHSEIIEFFKHIRNACAHNGKFDIRQELFKYKAKWNNKEITFSLNNKDLFGNFFAVGDSLLLLQDIEKHVKGKSAWLIKEEPPLFKKMPDGSRRLKDPRSFFYKIESILQKYFKIQYRN